MKRKSFIFNLGLILALFWGLASCTPTKDEVEDASISVNPAEINFSAQGGEQTVTITTNQSTWIATSPAEESWISLEKAGNTLTVKAVVNTRPTQRKSYILINSGGTAQRISLSQAAAESILSTDNPVISVPNTGGVYNLNVNSNDPSWTAEVIPAVDWIEMTYNSAAKTITFIVKPNEAHTPRETNILGASHDKKKTMEIRIEQAAAPKYTLPLLLTEYTGAVQVIDYENSIGNRFNIQLPADRANPNNRYLFFNRLSGYGSREYHIAPRKHYGIKVVDVSYDDNLMETDYMQFLKENGFEEQVRQPRLWIGLNEEKEFAVELKSVKNEGTIITFHRVYVQDQDHPTFDKVYDEEWTRFLRDSTANFEKVKAYAAEKGWREANLGKVPKTGKHKFQVENVSYHVDKSLAPWIASGYLFAWEDNTPTEMLGRVDTRWTLYSNVNLGFWRYKDSDQYYPTRELITLLRQNGWEYIGYVTPRAKFTKDDIGLTIRTVTWSNYNQGQIGVAVYAYRIDVGPSGHNAEDTAERQIDTYRLANGTYFFK